MREGQRYITKQKGRGTEGETAPLREGLFGIEKLFDFRRFGIGPQFPLSAERTKEGLLQVVCKVFLNFRSESPMAQQNTESANASSEHKNAQNQQRVHHRNSKIAGRKSGSAASFFSCSSVTGALTGIVTVSLKRSL
jgi:hypothetical protein